METDDAEEEDNFKLILHVEKNAALPSVGNLFNHSIVCCYCICVLFGNQRLLAQFHVSNPSNTTVPLLLCLPTFLSILAGRSWLPR